MSMSMSNSSRRLVSPAVCHKGSPLGNILLPFLHPSLAHRRTLFEGLFGRKKKEPPQFLDPLHPDFLKRSPTAGPPDIKRGDLAPSTIFDSPTLTPGTDPSTSRAEAKIARDPAALAAVLDPKPFARQRWERKMIIRGIRTQHRMSKTVKIARTERVSLSKSHMLKTSIKKLGPLARQIAGKPIDDAIVQMRFSKKKAAAEVKKLLELAKNNATVRRGMGLGQAKPIVKDQNETTTVPEGKEAVREEKEKPIIVLDRKGNRRLVTDRTSMYIDEAWVGRGKYGKDLLHRARGRIDTMRPPWTSITVVLKEEATRIRLAQEKEQKRQRQKIWVQMPDRPITAQRQYCLW